MTIYDVNITPEEEALIQVPLKINELAEIDFANASIVGLPSNRLFQLREENIILDGQINIKTKNDVIDALRFCGEMKDGDISYEGLKECLIGYFRLVKGTSINSAQTSTQEILDRHFNEDSSVFQSFLDYHYYNLMDYLPVIDRKDDGSYINQLYVSINPEYNFYDKKLEGRELREDCLGNIYFENKEEKRITIIPEEYSSLKKRDKSKEQYQMYMDIEFPTTRRSQIGEMLRKIGNGKVLTMIPSFPMETFSKTFNVKYVPDDPNIQTTFEEVIWDVKGDEDIQFVELLTTLFDENNGIGIEEFFKMKILKSKMMSFAENNKASATDLFNDNQSYSEILLYEIEKRDETGELLQTIVLPDLNDERVINYIDTQVKYGKKYVYQIFAYYYVIGGKFKIRREDDRVKLLSEPLQNIYRIPWTNKIERVIYDYPPLPPDFEIVPFRGNDSQILMNFNNGIGMVVVDDKTMTQKYEGFIVDKEDVPLIQNFETAHPEDSNYIFTSDDYPKYVQIFRTDVKPLSYSDFSGKKIKTLIYPVMSAIDDIESNRYYYYMFRSIDQHDHLSYQSEVVEIRLVNNDGAVYLDMNVLDEFAEGGVEKEVSKSARRYIHLSPNFLQSVFRMANEKEINSAKEVTKSDIIVGSDELEEKIWGKRFVMKITSKHTGRTMFLNINTDRKHIPYIDPNSFVHVVPTTIKTIQKEDCTSI